MQAAKIVQEARVSPSRLPSSQVLQGLTYQVEGITEDGYDPHAEMRSQVFKALRNARSLNDRPLLRFLMEQEIACRQNDTETDADSIHLGGFLLFLFGQLEDVELLWRAKRASFDTWYGFNGELLVGAGVVATLAVQRDVQQS